MSTEIVVREVRLGDLAEAGRLAEMWNNSHEGWPHGWNGGVAVTAERQLEDLRRQQAMATLVIEEVGRGTIAGYCRLEAMAGLPDSAYVALLNVRADRRGHGYGKALLLASLDQAMAHGCRRLALDTWPGNLRAVPLYKKCGFFWEPDTSVNMVNHVPEALALPAAKPYFVTHDWYSTLCRELTVAPDDVTWHGQKVYPYRWQAEDGTGFAMWVDRAAGAVTALETDAWSVACWVTGYGAELGVEDVLCGLPARVTWELINRRPERGPQRLALLAEGQAGLGVSVSETLEVADSVVLERPLTVPVDLPRPAPGQPQWQILSTLLLPDGTPVRLGSAVRAAPALELQIAAPRLTPARRGQHAKVSLRNRLPHPVSAELRFDPTPGLVLPTDPLGLSAPALGWGGVEAEVVPAREDVFRSAARLTVRATANPALPLAGADLTLKPQETVLVAAAMGRTMAWEEQENELSAVETPLLRVIARRRGGDLLVATSAGQHLAYVSWPAVGPPFAEWPASPPLAETKIERDGELTRVVQSRPVEPPAGLTLERTTTFGGGPVLTLDHRLLNATDAEQVAQLNFTCWPGVTDVLALPLADGLLLAPTEGWGGHGSSGEDIPSQPTAYAEGWYCHESTDGLALGLVFGSCLRRTADSVTFQLLAVPAHGAIELPSVHLWAGRGGWAEVRALWRALHGDLTTNETEAPRPLPLLSVAWSPAPALLTSAEQPLELSVVSLRGVSLSGELAVTLDDHRLTVEPASGAVAEVKLGQPGTLSTTARLADSSPRAVVGRASLVQERETRSFEAPLVVLGDASATVTIDQLAGEAWCLDNGRLALTVGAGRLAAAYSLVWRGAERLRASWPEPRPHGWMNPWRGGLGPTVGSEGAPWLAAESSTVEPVERNGARGLAWRGLGLRLAVAHRDRRWLRLETDLLTYGDSNVVAVVQRWVNTSDAWQRADGGLSLWLADGAEGAAPRLCYESLALRSEAPGGQRLVNREEREHRPDATGRGQAGLGWVAADGAGGAGWLVVVGSTPGQALSFSVDREAGAHLTATGGLDLEPQQTRETVTWLVCCDDLEQALAYRCLSGLSTLP